MRTRDNMSQHHTFCRGWVFVCALTLTIFMKIVQKDWERPILPKSIVVSCNPDQPGMW